MSEILILLWSGERKKGQESLSLKEKKTHLK